MNEELQELMHSNPEWYKDLQYQDVKVYIKDNINSVSRSFVAIGYYLKYVRDNELFTEDGYSSIWEFAQGEFGIGKSSASQFMSINDKFAVDGNSPILQERYRDFSSSKLAEMLTMTEEQLEQVSPTTTIVEIREIKKPVETVLTSEQKPPSNYIHQPEAVKDEPEIVNDVDEKGCRNCNYNDMTMDELDAMGFDGNYPCNICDDKLDQWIPKHEPDPVETLEADIIQSESEEVKKGTAYSLNAVGLLMQKAKSDYEKAVQVGGCPESLVEKRLIIRDALLDYYQELRGRDTVWYKKPQPELPILKNNDQRKAFIEAFESWPIWIDIKETGERYYRYDFDSGVSFIIRVSLCHKFLGWNNDVGYSETEVEYGKEEYFLLGGVSNKWEPKVKTFVESATNKSAMIEYLKDYQKKK